MKKGFAENLIIFDSPAKKEKSAWIMHTPVAFFLVSILKPKLFVELGVYTGYSYNCFCQAVKALKTYTFCYGIDTWKGDEHAGFCAEDVYQQLLEYQTKEYSEFSHLLRMTFDEALAYFSDQSIDLLHIDGLHTYEAVRHDFEKWLPKISDKGVILLHDTMVREHNFGVWKLWNEVAPKYPSYNFTHGYGLGILAVGPNVNNDFLDFLNVANSNLFYQKLFFSLGMLRSYDAIVEEKDSQIAHLEELTRKKDSQIAHLEDVVRESGAEIDNLRAGLAEIDNLRAGLAEKDGIIANLNETVAKKDARISHLEATLNHISNSHGWKALLVYYKLRDKILPPNTKRRLWAKIALKAVLNPGYVFRSINKTNMRKLIYYLKTADPYVLGEKIDRKFTEDSYRGSVTHLEVKFDNAVKIGELEDICFQKVIDPRVSIVIPVWNKWRYTYHCLKALLENTTDVPYEVILVDNASTDETPQMVEKIKNIKLIRNEENLGFIKACNIGVKESSGEYVLFLNNDTQVTKGWLKSMVELVEKDKSIGLVGAKLIYPDGKLQEAGGIVWNDPVNLAWNYGRYDNPDKWEYNYVKEVDYCSGACLLVRKDLFERVGLFDTQFSPAYCEDTDLAFSIRKLGYKVVYQPKAEIIHFEGITAGTDTSKGFKNYQVINQAKFYKKWKDTLEKEHFKNGENVFLARDRLQKKKIMLFVDHYVPTHDKDAGSFIAHEYLKIFIEIGFKIVFWPDNLFKKEPYTSELQQMGIEVVYGSADFKKYIRNYGNYIDVACLSRPHIAINYIDEIRWYSNAKTVYLPHDLHYLRELRRAETENNPRVLIEADGLKSKELYIMENSNVTIVFSNVEKGLIEKENPGINVMTFPWIQALHGREKVFSQKKDLIFIGGFAHKPNEDAVLWFVREIFPLIKKEIPDVTFLILGSHPTERILKLKSNDIVVTGYIKDVSSYFQDAKVFVAPLRYGAGFKGKIIHAMSYGLPVVTTSIGAEGMGLKGGEEVLIADEPQDFAKKVLELYTNEDLWISLSNNSLRHVQENNSPEVAKKKFVHLFDELGIRIGR